MSDFVKVSALKDEDRTMLREYWTDLWGSEFADKLVQDYKPEGKTKQVEASAKTKSVKQ